MQSEGLSRVFSNTTVQKHRFFRAQPSLWSNSHIPYMTTGKIALTICTFVDKVMALLFNMLSRFVIPFLPRSNCLLISWLQSPSTVILEPRKINQILLGQISNIPFTPELFFSSNLCLTTQHSFSSLSVFILSHSLSSPSFGVTLALL